MPEGHTLHRLAREHRRRFVGAPVRVSSPQGRFDAGAAAVDGRTLERSESNGKHLLLYFDGGRTVHVHLGLYGRFDFAPTPLADPVGQVRMRMIGAESGADLRGPTACDIYDATQIAALEARLGPDPLRADADPDRAWQRISRSRTPIGALLLDQSVLAGVGNVYRAEVLFRHGIHPDRPGRHVGRADWDAMWTDLVALMAVGVDAGVMHVVRPEHDHGAPSYAPDRPRTYVYRRTGSACRICGTPIAHTVMKGRNLFWCPGCQPD